MTRPTSLALALCAAATAAPAQVTSEDVWAHWQTAVARGGELAGNGTAGALTAASSRRGGGVLRLDGVRNATESAGFSLIQSTAWIELADQGDGTVRMTMAPEQDVLLRLGDGSSDALVLPVRLAFDGYAAVLSGVPDRLETRATMEALRVIEVFPGDGDPVRVDFGLTGAATDAVSSVAEGAVAFAGTARADTLALKLTGTLAEDAPLDLDLALAGVTLRRDDRIFPRPEGAALVIPGAFVGGGIYALDAESGWSSAPLSGGSGPPLGMIETTTGPTGIALTLTTDAVAVDSVSRDLRYRVTGTGLPAGIAVAIDEYRQDMAFPFGRVGETGRMRFGLDMLGLTLGDDTWALFDPAGVLPRDPAVVSLGLSGDFGWRADLDAIAAWDDDAPPFTLGALALDRFEIAAAGAALTGAGGLTLDLAPLAEGAPAGIAGKLRFQADGVDGLIADLVGIGLLPADQVMAVRMGLAMVAMPGGAPGRYVTDIGFPGDGTVTVNGMAYPLDGFD
jgi:hypothetical protein